MKSDILYSAARLLYLYGEIGYYNRLLLKFDDSLAMFDKAQLYSKGKSVSSYNITLSKVIVNIYLKNYHVALLDCQDLLKDDLKGFRYEKSVTNFYSAIAYFGIKTIQRGSNGAFSKN